MTLNKIDTNRMYIIENIAHITDDELFNLYEKMNKILSFNDHFKRDRTYMISYIEENIIYIDDKSLLKIKTAMDIFMYFFVIRRKTTQIRL